MSQLPCSGSITDAQPLRVTARHNCSGSVDRCAESWAKWFEGKKAKKAMRKKQLAQFKKAQSKAKKSLIKEINMGGQK